MRTTGFAVLIALAAMSHAQQVPTADTPPDHGRRVPAGVPTRPGVGIPGVGPVGGGGLPLPRIPSKKGPPKRKKGEIPPPDYIHQGMLRALDKETMVLETDDHRFIAYGRTDDTLLMQAEKPLKDADFQPGDRVVVESVQGEEAKRWATRLLLERKATADELARARMPIPKVIDMADSTKSDAEARDISGTAVGSAATRPPATKPSAAPTGAQPSADGAEPAEVASNDTPTTIRRSPQEQEEDPGRPRIRRGIPPKRTSSASVETASLSTGAPPPASVPLATIQIDENGRPETSAAANGSATDPYLLEMRAQVVEYLDRLPNFTVNQITNRYGGSLPKPDWRLKDQVTAEVIYDEGKDLYRNVKVGGKLVPTVAATGATSTGEFGNILRSFLGDMSSKKFIRRPSGVYNGRDVFVYDFEVPQPVSDWTLAIYGSEQYRPAYKGSIWIEKATKRVLRFERQAYKMPGDFPLQSAEQTIDYDYIKLGQTDVLVPSKADTLSCWNQDSSCFWNRIEFRNYRRYGSTSEITFGDAVTAPAPKPAVPPKKK